MYNNPCTCTGFWSCSKLTTPQPASHHIRDRTNTFIAAYREAKKLNILTCPHFQPREIGRKIDTFKHKKLSEKK